MRSGGGRRTTCLFYEGFGRVFFDDGIYIYIWRGGRGRRDMRLEKNWSVSYGLFFQIFIYGSFGYIMRRVSLSLYERCKLLRICDLC